MRSSLPGHVRERGNALIEFSLLLPWLFMLFTGVFDFGFLCLRFDFRSECNPGRRAPWSGQFGGGWRPGGDMPFGGRRTPGAAEYWTVVYQFLRLGSPDRNRAILRRHARLELRRSLHQTSGRARLAADDLAGFLERRPCRRESVWHHLFAARGVDH